MNKKIIIFIFFIGLSILSYFLFSKEEKITNYPSNGTDIIAFGDSLVEGVGATKGNDFVSLLSKKINQPIVNLGKSGDTTKDGLDRIHELDNYDPKVVILLLGGNDYLKKIPIQETRKNFGMLIENIHSRGGVVILLGVRGGVLGDPFKEEFENLKNIYKTAYVSDVLSGLIGNSKYMSDAIHPNNVGYEKISERVFPILNKLIN